MSKKEVKLLSEVLDEVDRDFLLEIILNLSKGDDNVEKLVRAMVDPKSLKESLGYYKKIVLKGIPQFVDYFSVYRALYGATEARELAEKFEEINDYTEVCTIHQAIFEVHTKTLQKADDSDGSISGVIYDSFEKWAENVPKISDPKEKQKCLDLAVKKITEPNFTDFGFEFELIEFLLKFLTNKTDVLYLYKNLENFIIKDKLKVKFLWLLDRFDEAVEVAFASQDKQAKLLGTDILIQQSQFNEVRKILKAEIDNKKNPFWVYFLKRYLSLYPENLSKEEYLTGLYQILFRRQETYLYVDGEPGFQAEKVVDELKQLDPQNWPQKKELYVAQLKKEEKYQDLLNFYKHENMLTEMATLATSSNSVYFLRDLATEFEKTHPQIAVEIWEKMIWLNLESKVGGKASTNYNYVIKLLKQMFKSGFPEKVSQLCLQIRAQHSKKYSLMSLLDEFEDKYLSV